VNLNGKIKCSSWRALARRVKLNTTENEMG
jgi:hypothetical protein